MMVNGYHYREFCRVRIIDFLEILTSSLQSSQQFLQLFDHDDL